MYTLEKEDIVINGWENGISDNPYEGISDIRNIDNSTIHGEVSVAMRSDDMMTQGAITGVAYTVDHTTDIFTYDGVVPLEVNTAILFTNVGGAAPAGITVTDAYYIKTTPTPTTFTIATSAGGTQKLVTDNGSGTNTFSTIKIGIPLSFATVYWGEYPITFMFDYNDKLWVYNSGILGSTNKWVYVVNASDDTDTSYYTGRELIGWKDYLFLTSPNYLWIKPLWNPATGIPSLSYTTSSTNPMTIFVQTSSTGSSLDPRPIVVDPIDGSLRFGLDNIVQSIQEIAGQTFRPAAGAISAADGVTTNTSTTITTTTNYFTSDMVGSLITDDGGNIPAGAYIVSRTNSKTAIISEAATGSDTGLVFTVPTTWTHNTNSVQGIPEDDMVTSLTFLGQNLLIGGMFSFIYVWDRLATSYNYPIYLSESYVRKMVTVNTTTYIFAGYNGRIYMTNGSNISFYKELPDHLSKTVNPYFMFTSATFNRNKLYFGVQCFTNAGVAVEEYGGLWAIDLITNSIIQQNITSKNTYAGFVSAVMPFNFMSSNPYIPRNDGYGLMIGWTATNGTITTTTTGSYTKGTLGGVDRGVATPYIAGESYVVSDMIPVGQFLTPKTFERLEYKLSNPLVAGETVALAYRTNISEAFTDVPITQGGGTGDISGVGYSNFQNVQWIQIKATMTSTATSPSYVRLKEIRIK